MASNLEQETSSKSIPVPLGFTFDSSSIAKVIKGNMLIVPPHQREYSWKNEHVEKLLDDFEGAQARKGNYFLGSVVLIPEQKRLRVIDGQQRLTTTQLLIHSLIQELKSQQQETEVIYDLEKDYLRRIDRDTLVSEPHLSLNVQDNEFYQAILKGEKPEEQFDSHRLLNRARGITRDFISGKVSNLDKKAAISLINKWLSFLEDRAIVITVEVSDPAQAYRMFETLNDRGLEISKVDLIKNYLFGRAGDRIDEAQTYWATVVNILETIKERASVDNYIRHYIAATEKRVLANEIFSYVQKNYKTDDEVITFMSDLASWSKIYVGTYNSENTIWKDYSLEDRKVVDILNSEMDSTIIRPLILAIAKKLKPKKAAEFLKILLSILVRRAISSRSRSASVEDTFFTVASQITSQKIPDSAIFKEKLRSLIVADNEFVEAAKTARVSKGHLARYYLRCLEKTKAGTAPLAFIPNDNTSHVNLEHILPRSPDLSEWPNFDKDQSRGQLTRLGNLCLLTTDDNVLADNQAFSEKAQIYENSEFLLTKEVAKFSDWSTETIAQRQSDLAELVVQTWPI